MSNPAFFSYDPNGDGYEEHHTAEAAQRSAQARLDSARKEAEFGEDNEGWPDDTSRICWGQVLGRATVTSRGSASEDDSDDAGVDFTLEPVTPPETLPRVADDYAGPCWIEVSPDWRDGKGRFYLPGSNGYTDDKGRAGVWNAMDARKRTHLSSRSYPVAALALPDVPYTVTVTSQRIVIRGTIPLPRLVNIQKAAGDIIGLADEDIWCDALVADRLGVVMAICSLADSAAWRAELGLGAPRG